MAVVTLRMLEALKAFHAHCLAGEGDWVATRERYESIISDADGDVDPALEDVVQDLYHRRWTPPESDPLRVAVLHARRGLPWRVYLPAAACDPSMPDHHLSDEE